MRIMYCVWLMTSALTDYVIQRWHVQGWHVQGWHAKDVVSAHVGHVLRVEKMRVDCCRDSARRSKVVIACFTNQRLAEAFSSAARRDTRRVFHMVAMAVTPSRH